jgi:hypothetical protein
MRGCAARIVTLEPGLYAFTLPGVRYRRERIPGLPLPAIQVCAATAGGGFEITDEAGRPGSWLGGGMVLFVKSPEGGAALVTAYLAREADAPPLDVEIRRIDRAGDRKIAASVPNTGLPPLMTLRLDASDAAAASTSSVRLDAIAHIRGRGDVRFAGGGVIGRLGPGLWIEAFAIASPDAAAAVGIEYKGLSASGSETPWLDCGSICGEAGTGIALLGFAVRQKAGSGSAARFDCEYSGYFQSGSVVGPLRNGAPCRSPRDNDALEGMALSVTPRPLRG